MSVHHMRAQPENVTKIKKADTQESKTDLLPPNAQLINPCETLRCALNNIRQKNRDTVIQGLSLAVQLSRSHPNLLEPHMTRINQCLSQQLLSTHTNATRFACQAAKELFKTMQNTARPEFDEIVSRLLNRTADSNKLIRFDANSALDHMVMYVSPISAVRALVWRGPSHKNPLVRIATARLLVCTATIVGVNVLFTSSMYQKTRKRMIESAALLMDDTHLETKNTAKSLFEMFVKDDNFEQIFYNEMDQKLVDELHKTVTIMRYTDKANV
ncbi:TOG array regulator of axonemal microtubules protein 2 isoform X2 [Nilaparvata lugens]|uniref:TOG array regulator of axonemal microtubules protein 2 isoform X2 n=1 Tax=Nilaparvata lugens TaxID=108931 RepID=UPI00193E351C|nr:TOG array regulator of axonemal microtubules protein 2 isoform X2 [Nilaparvata lugens]